MESSEEPTSLQSICHLRASELFPKPAQVDCEDPNLSVPFVLLSGEYVVSLGRTSDGVLALSNYRLYLQLGQGCYNVPLGLIEHLEVKEIFYLHIGCKDARSIRFVWIDILIAQKTKTNSMKFKEISYFWSIFCCHSDEWGWFFKTSQYSIDKTTSTKNSIITTIKSFNKLSNELRILKL